MLIYEKENKLNIIFSKENIDLDKPDIVISDENGVVSVNSNSGIMTLPKVTSAEDGKSLIVENGEWVLK